MHKLLILLSIVLSGCAWMASKPDPKELSPYDDPTLRAEVEQATPDYTRLLPYDVLLIEGWMHGVGETRDLSRLREALDNHGVHVYTVPTSPTAAIESNARIVGRVLAAQERPYVLVSASKGSAEFLLAYRHERTDLSKMIGWLNISGLIDGSEVADFFMQPPILPGTWVVSWFTGWQGTQGIDSMQTKRVKFTRLPEHIRVLSIVTVDTPKRVADDAPWREFTATLMNLMGAEWNDGLIRADAQVYPGGKILLLRNQGHMVTENASKWWINALMEVVP